MARIGLQFSESMSGTYERADAPGTRRRFTFHVDARCEDWSRALRGARTEITGFVEAEGLAAHAPLRGSMLIHPLGKRVIRYEFDFAADDGARLRFAGQKDISLLHPVRTMTTLPGTIFDAEGRAVAHATVRFALRDLPSFVLGFRLRRVPPSTQPA